MFCLLFLICVALLFAQAEPIYAQTFEQIRDDQFDRLADYVGDAIMPSGLVRDSLVLNPNGNSFHPATPDAAGFALLALSALDHVGKFPGAEQKVIDILSAYTGQTPGVNPERSADGHYIHFMNVVTGADEPGWDDSYSPIGSALIVAGAEFAKNHYSDNATIASLTQQLSDSIDFNAAIHPSLDGRIFLDMTKQGGGSGSAVRPWNEYMLVQSLALREERNDRAVAVKHLWLNPDNVPKANFAGNITLGDGGFAPAFWVQQMQFFNGDFRHSEAFQPFLLSQQSADQDYSGAILDEAFRYGLTAGVIPNGYHADRLFNHPFDVFSPEAVAAWGDIDTLLQFYAEQMPTSNPRYRYGMVRVSAEDPDWIPNDAGLVDHLFLLFGLIETVDADFFSERVIPALVPGDYNGDRKVDSGDYAIWLQTLGSTTDLRADGSLNGMVGPEDYEFWKARIGQGDGDLGAGSSRVGSAIPEPASGLLLVTACAALAYVSRRINLLPLTPGS